MSELFLDLVRIGDLPPGDDQRWAQWLSAGELAVCRALARAPEHQAARLAAKRALGTALAAGPDTPWADIEVGRQPFGPPRVLLRGAVAVEARRRCVRPQVSLTHAAGYAAALAWLPAS
jgi:holo-[acyl-carrier protein] synthase